MSKTEILEELPKLQPDERREILEKIYELEGASRDGWLDDGELTREEKALIMERLADMERHPERGIPWAEAEARLLARFGE